MTPSYMDSLDRGTRIWVANLMRDVPFPYPPAWVTKYFRDVAKWKRLDAQREAEIASAYVVLRGVWRTMADTSAEAYTRGGEVFAVNAAKSDVRSRLAPALTAVRESIEVRFLNPGTPVKARGFELVGPGDIPELRKWNANVLASNITNISTSLEKRIRNIVSRGVSAGKDVSDIAKEIARLGFPDKRALVIARTEAIGAANAATFFGTRHSAGARNLRKTWFATQDNRTRDTHKVAGRDQIDIPYDTPFTVGESQLMFPGDTSLGASAKEIVNCRCTFTSRRR